MYVTTLQAKGQQVAVTHTCWSLQGTPWIRTANGSFHIIRVQSARGDRWSGETHESAEVERMAEEPSLNFGHRPTSRPAPESTYRRRSFLDW